MSCDELKSEIEVMLDQFQKELENCDDLAQKLDSLNPELEGAFTGTPSQRILRQLKSYGFFMSQSQESLNSQLRQLYRLANVVGLYDAADQIKDVCCIN